MNGYPNIFCQTCGGDPEGGFCYCTKPNHIKSILCDLKVEEGPTSKRLDRTLGYAIKRLRDAGGALPEPGRPPADPAGRGNVSTPPPTISNEGNTDD